MRKFILTALLAAMLPMSMMAQGYHFVQHANGLEYICKDGDPEDDDHLFIWVGSSAMPETVSNGTEEVVVMENRYFVEKNIRPAWRRAYNGADDNTNGPFYKKKLDAITTITETRNNSDTYKGVEYFTNLESLTIASKNASSVELDLSKNTKLKTLTFSEAALIKLATLNISNTQLTSLTIPSGSRSTLVNLYVNNSKLTALNVSSCTALRTLEADYINFSSNTALQLPTRGTSLDELSVEHSTGLTSLNLGIYSSLATLHVNNSSVSELTLPTSTGVLKHLNISNAPGLSTHYTHANPLDVSKYPRLVAVADGHSNTGGTLIYNDSGLSTYLGEDGNLKIYPDDAEFIYHVCSGEELTRDYMDYSDHPNLIGLILVDANGVILPANRTTFTLDLTGSPNIEDVISFDNSKNTLTTLDAINVKKLDVSTCDKLQTLLYTEPASGELTLSTTSGSYPDLKTLVLTRSSVPKIDLSGGVAPNLELFRAYYSALEEINLSDHAQLHTLSILPPKEGHDDPESVQNSGGIDKFNEGYKLKTLNIKNCTSLTGGLTLNYEGENWKYYNALEYIDASGCNQITRFNCQNNLLTHLDLSGCSALEEINITQGLLTGNGDINLSGCSNLKEFYGSRNCWESMDFLLTPSSGRTAKDIGKLEVVRVNGGSYTLQKEDGERYVRQNGDDTLVYTSRLTELNLENLVNGTFKVLYCEDNLLTSLDLKDIGPGMTSLKCANNMMLTLNLSTLNTTDLDEENSSWSPQVAYLNAEAVKGDDGTDETEGAHDWVALHLPEGGNGGYTHALDNDLDLYENLWSYFNGGDPIAHENTPWMCLVSETAAIAAYEGEGSKFAGNYLHHEGHSGYHLFLHSQSDIQSTYGSMRDQDLYGKVLHYRYNTGYNRVLGENPINHKTDTPTATKRTADNNLDPHIEIRAHIWPYMINLHPLTKNAQSKDDDGQIDYYSSTLYLDYDAVIPDGVSVYFVEGITSRGAIETGGTTTTPNQVTMRLFGGVGSDNKILPAYTPVYVRSRSKLKDGGEKTGQAGLYAFEPVWEFDIKGWENLRNIEGYPNAPHILHGVQKGDPRVTKTEYVTPLANAIEKKKSMMYVDDEGKKVGNILTGIIGEKYDETDMTAQYFNLYKANDEKHLTATDTVLAEARTCLTLSLQTQKLNTRVIGFWPYNGTQIPFHRCIILEKDYEDAIAAAEKKGETVDQSAGAKGGSFLFLDDEIDITGIEETLADELRETGDSGWYTMQGIRLNQQPRKRGIYIHNGRKVTIK